MSDIAAQPVPSTTTFFRGTPGGGVGIMPNVFFILWVTSGHSSRAVVKTAEMPVAATAPAVSALTKRLMATTVE